MSHHQFRSGQLVRRIGRIGAPARSCTYEIINLVADEQGELRYRTKGIALGIHEVGEHELVAASRPLPTSARIAAVRL
ncbi:protein of unknown function [Methylorubrum extorquens]|uniref:Uncharacterized protein n=1 Tax=Methylorubrum extorquens TaxID=408 RepID=A0A2N9AXN6_METEX|nr:hypothetical protein [Methylobacterium sp. Leaf122]SOR32087.1 protein of unknown function [Methylorubrum extorquens]